ncbi:nucleotidyltransferase protein [Spatholobus suberectus]|nr:nucleotidyltransferase protein [Spatholobus suberectus]
MISKKICYHPPHLASLLSIDEELRQMAEERAQEILWTIEPNVLSEVNRKDVIDYVQRLIRGSYGAEVFPFGSVPLKTYLPDGDIDLTALSHEDAEEDLAQAVCNILQSGDDPEYQVKDIQYIRAQVQLVKCTVKNIAVDITFNQMAGLYTLCFLEQVDQLVGRNHIFKRSIILIKAWCYYESRLLGGHHGLLSTYAIEILVLYIINRFHSSVRGPLEVLYIFLDYYGTFDWDHNYISIWGPKALPSLPEIVGKCCDA